MPGVVVIERRPESEVTTSMLSSMYPSPWELGSTLVNPVPVPSLSSTVPPSSRSQSNRQGSDTNWAALQAAVWVVVVVVGKVVLVDPGVVVVVVPVLTMAATRERKEAISSRRTGF